MAHYKIAHIRQQGVDLIIVPLESSFEHQGQQAQSQTISFLQLKARAVGLAGIVVPVWRSGRSHRFIAPTPWHSFFKSLDWSTIMASINKELTF